MGDKHLRQLCQKHWGTRFVKINAEKAQYLSERLHVWCLPSLVLCKNGQTEHTIVGGCFLARVIPRAEALLQVQNASVSVVAHCLYYVDELKCASLCLPPKYKCLCAVFRCALVLAACCMPDAGLDITGVFDRCTVIPRMPRHCCESVDLLRVPESAFIT